MAIANFPLPSRFSFRISTLVPIVLVCALIFFLGSRNPVTPAGYVGYLTRGAILGHERFIGLQTGPTSSGRGWLLHVINVSVTPYTYDEEFSGAETVLSSDSLKIAFRVHLVWRVRPDRVKQFVENFSTLSPNDTPDRIVEVAYRNFLREPLRTYARDEVQKYKGLEIKDNIERIGETLTARVLKLTNDTPFEVRSVVVGNIQYPPEIVDAVSKKLAATQELERKNTEIEIAKREKEKRIIEAEGIAQATQIISQRLTGAYLQYEAIKAQQETVNSPNHTTIYIPVGPMGVPIVGNLNVSPSTDRSAKGTPAPKWGAAP
jgi:regulator of protease activity HflC (stomatin/prohibitin superfamily)